MTPKKLFYVMLVVLLATLALTAVGIYFVDGYLKEQSETIAILKADDELLSIELINAQGTVESLKTYRYIDVKANKILPNTKNQSEAILLINTIGNEVGINTESFIFLGTDGKPSEKSQTEPLEGAKGILVFPVQVKFDATYSQTINWLKLAEKNQRKMQVSSITMTVREVNGEYNPSDPLTVTVSINAYVENR